MASTEKKIFIVGAFFAVLGILALLIIQSIVTSNTKQENLAIITSSKDPLITKQLRPEDILPVDQPLITFIDPSRGAKNPKVIIVEFSDFSCPFCKSFQSTINKIVEKYPEDVLHVWKDAPHTALYPESMAAHSAARCAQKQQKFWEFHDALFNNQDTLSDIVYESIASSINMDQSAWQNCFVEKEERAKVERGLTEAEVLGVDSTPYLFINDKRISGATTFEKLELIITEELQNASQ